MDGVGYAWHLSGGWLEGRETVLTIAAATEPGWFLHVDPYPAVRGEFALGPKVVSEVIRWALGNDWVPSEPHEATFVSQEDGAWFGIPHGERERFLEKGWDGGVTRLWPR